jgi:hypothetical protein
VGFSCSSGPPCGVWCGCCARIAWLGTVRSMTRPNHKMDKPWWSENWEPGNHRPSLLAFWPPYVLCGSASDSVPNATFQLFQIYPIQICFSANKIEVLSKLALVLIASCRSSCQDTTEMHKWFVEKLVCSR